MTPPYCPTSKFLNTQAFGRIFDDTATSYKFLWVGAILKLLQGTGYREECFHVEDITVKMFISAYYPLIQCHISFGKQDQMRNYYGGLLHVGNIEDLTRDNIPVKTSQQLAKYVLFRVLTPFYKEELRGLLDAHKNEKIRDLANAQYDTNFPPFYRIGNNNEIFIHKMWRDYIKDNEQIIQAWLTYHWVKFLQDRNPNIPAIANKIEKPQERASMTNQRKFWLGLIEGQKIHCIYSKERIISTGFALDHYIPWNFIGHDQLWNLVPTTQSVNSSKSDNLPDKMYYDDFINLQHLSVKQLIGAPTKWRKLREEYEVSLRVPIQKLADKKQLRDSFDLAIMPMIELAKNAGFTNWKYPIKPL